MRDRSRLEAKISDLIHIISISKLSNAYIHSHNSHLIALYSENLSLLPLTMVMGSVIIRT